MQREPNTEYILSLSYGKDSLACLEAIKQLGYPLDRIVHAEVWATDTIPADLPPMIDFKAHADKIIKEKYGYTVEHICAVRGGKKLTYDTQFYEWINEGRNKDRIYGFPYTLGAWCNSRLKVNVLQSIARENNLRKTVLSYTQETEEASNGRGGEIHSKFSEWIPRAASPVVQFGTQKASVQTNQFSDFQSQEELGATATSKLLPYGFPISIGRGNWCTQLKQRVFWQPHCTRGEEKYCAVPRNCC